MENKKTGRVPMMLLSVLMCSLYIGYVVWLFWCHPFVACAAEKDDAVPGGLGNVVEGHFYTKIIGKDQYTVEDFIMEADSKTEIVFYYWGDDIKYMGMIFGNMSSGEINGSIISCTGSYSNYIDGELFQYSEYSINKLPVKAAFSDDRIVDYTLTGCKIFKDRASALAYIESGSLDGMIKEPVLDKEWYLKNVRGHITADDSPSSEAGEDATYIRFTWDTDNLQEGDLIEIKTHNYYKTLAGEEHGGFHDYITQLDNVSAFIGEYGPFSQYEATKAWFNTLEHKPLLFKSYDTDIYFIRPVRNGKVGGWVKIFMRRNPLTKAPDIEKVEYGDFDKEGNWIVNEGLTDKEGGYGTDHFGNKVYPDMDNPFEGTNLSGLFKSFFDFFKDIPSMLGGLPGLVNSTIGFLPNWVIGFIAIGIIVVIILRIVGR